MSLFLHHLNECPVLKGPILYNSNKNKVMYS